MYKMDIVAKSSSPTLKLTYCGRLSQIFGLLAVLSSIIDTVSLESTVTGDIWYPTPNWLLDEYILEVRDKFALPIHEYYDLPNLPDNPFTIQAVLKINDEGSFRELENSTRFNWEVLDQKIPDKSNKNRTVAYLNVDNFKLMSLADRGIYYTYCIETSFKFGRPLTEDEVGFSNLKSTPQCLEWRFKVVNASAPFDAEERHMSFQMSLQTNLQQAGISLNPTALESLGSLQARFLLTCKRQIGPKDKDNNDELLGSPFDEKKLPSLSFESKYKSTKELFDVPYSESKRSKIVNGYVVEYDISAALITIYYLCPTFGHKVLTGLKVVRECREVSFFQVDSKRIVVLCMYKYGADAYLFKVQRVKDMQDNPDWVVSSESTPLGTLADRCRYSKHGQQVVCRTGPLIPSKADGVIIFKLRFDPLLCVGAREFDSQMLRAAYFNWIGLSLDDKDLHFNYASGSSKGSDLIVVNAFVVPVDFITYDVQICLMYLNIGKLDAGVLTINEMKCIYQNAPYVPVRPSICELDKSTFLFNPSDGTVVGDGPNFNKAQFGEPLPDHVSLIDEECLEELGIYIICARSYKTALTHLLVYNSRELSNAYNRVMLHQVLMMNTTWMGVEHDAENKLLYISLQSTTKNLGHAQGQRMVYRLDLSRKIPKIEVDQGLSGTYVCYLNKTGDHASFVNKSANFSIEINSPKAFKLKQLQALPLLNPNTKSQSLIDIEDYFKFEGLIHHAQLAKKSISLIEQDLVFLKPRTSLRYQFQNEAGDSEYLDVDFLDSEVMVGFKSNNVDVLQLDPRAFQTNKQTSEPEHLLKGTFTQSNSLEVLRAEQVAGEYTIFSQRIHTSTYKVGKKHVLLGMYHYMSRNEIDTHVVFHYFAVAHIERDAETGQVKVTIPDRKPDVIQERQELNDAISTDFTMLVSQDPPYSRGNTVLSAFKFGLSESREECFIRFVMYTKNKQSNTWVRTNSSKLTTISGTDLRLKDGHLNVEKVTAHLMERNEDRSIVSVMFFQTATSFYTVTVLRAARDSTQILGTSRFFLRNLLGRVHLYNCSALHKTCIFLLETGRLVAYSWVESPETGSWGLSEHPSQSIMLGAPVMLNGLLIGSEHVAVVDNQRDGGIYIYKVISLVGEPFKMATEPFAVVPTEYSNGHLIKMAQDPDAGSLPENNAKEGLIVTYPHSVGRFISFGPLRLVVSPQELQIINSKDLEALSLRVNFLKATDTFDPRGEVTVPLGLSLKHPSTGGSRPGEQNEGIKILVWAFLVLLVMLSAYCLNSVWYVQRTKDAAEDSLRLSWL